jgi:hypothetical protein
MTSALRDAVLKVPPQRVAAGQRRVSRGLDVPGRFGLVLAQRELGRIRCGESSATGEANALLARSVGIASLVMLGSALVWLARQFGSKTRMPSHAPHAESLVEDGPHAVSRGHRYRRLGAEPRLPKFRLAPGHAKAFSAWRTGTACERPDGPPSCARRHGRPA